MVDKNDLWVEKYRPSGIDGYVFKNDTMKETVQEWIANPEGKRIPFPHLLLTGVQGTGKTTLAYILCNEFEVEKGDILYINASRNSGIDEVRNSITNFCSTYPWGSFKVVILDEVDGFSPAAQKALRAEMETHSDTCRFILTANYPQKIIPAVHSRTQSFHLDGLDDEGFLTRILEVLIAEEVEFEIDDVMVYVEKTKPDLRKCINIIQQNTRSKKLHQFETDAEVTLDYITEFYKMFVRGDHVAARKYLCANIKDGQFEDVYRFLKKNLDIVGSDDVSQSMAMLAIADGARDHAISFDPEIALSACIIKLSQIGNP